MRPRETRAMNMPTKGDHESHHAQKKVVHPCRKSASSRLNRTGFLGDLIAWEDGVYGTSKAVFARGARARGPEGRGAPGAHGSERAVLQSVAPKLGCTAETLRKWVRPTQRDAGHWPGLTTSERERLKELERESCGRSGT